MKNLIIFCLVTLVLCYSSPLCPGFNEADLMQSGSIQLSNNKNKDSSKQCYRVSINYNVPESGFSTALTFREFDNSKPTIAQNLFIKGGQIKKQNVLGIAVVNKDQKWQKISVSYFVSSRTDLLVGSFLADALNQNYCSQDNSNTLVNAIIPTLAGSEHNYSGSLFISGIDAKNSNFDLEIKLIKIDTKLGRIQLQINGNIDSTVSLLQITYILKKQNFPFQTITNNLGLIKYDQYGFSGLSSFRRGPKYSSQAYNSQKLFCKGSACQQQCTTVIGCKLQGGQIESRNCIRCEQSEKYENSKCIPKCSSNQIYINRQCVRPSCPKDSFWNQMLLQCQCYGQNKYVINGQCLSCPSSEQWDFGLKQCKCSSGTYRVRGRCIKCKINERYNEEQQVCQCNYGFFMNTKLSTLTTSSTKQPICQSCHPTCGRCFGPNIGQCLQCSDVSYSFENGFCNRKNPCPVGLYLSEDNCYTCSAYCQSCQNENICDKCIDGFQKTQIVYGGMRATYCVEICGDGKRFEVQCDDNNLKNGDGCNQFCETEQGWTCLGGSTIKQSQCYSQPPSKTQVALTGTVHLFGRIVQGVRLSYIPPQLTANDCANCSKLLWIRVIESHIVPGVRINYLPKSKYQFLAQFQFNGIFAIPVFQISVQINPDFARYFKDIDLAQIIVKQVDPSTLKVSYKQQSLSLDEMVDDVINVSDGLIHEIFSKN